MKILTPRIHGYLDYFTVVFLLLAPTLFGLAGAPAIIAYVLAAVHLAMTLLTAFPLGVTHLIPFPIHGAVELSVAVVLMAAPWLLSGVFAGARVFYTIVGAAIFLVWLLTDYRRRAIGMRLRI